VIVCHCFAVRAEEVRTEVRLGAETVDVVSQRCGAASRCRGCLPAVQAVISDEIARADDALVRH
jgi:bacterioferritin-associated ferredoxin